MSHLVKIFISFFEVEVYEVGIILKDIIFQMKWQSTSIHSVRSQTVELLGRKIITWLF